MKALLIMILISSTALADYSTELDAAIDAYTDALNEAKTPAERDQLDQIHKGDIDDINREFFKGKDYEDQGVDSQNEE